MESQISLAVEALIFASDRSITDEEIVEILLACGNEQADLTGVREAVQQVERKFETGGFAIRLCRINGGYQFLTDKAHYQLINQLQVQRSRKKLSQAAIETLAIIAYRQPVTKTEIEQVRGVNADYTIQKLLEKELIQMAGKAEGPGKPVLYVTSALFMDYFGINSANELPRMKDLSAAPNSIGAELE